MAARASGAVSFWPRRRRRRSPCGRVCSMRSRDSRTRRRRVRRASFGRLLPGDSSRDSADTTQQDSDSPRQSTSRWPSWPRCLATLHALVSADEDARLNSHFAGVWSSPVTPRAYPGMRAEGFEVSSHRAQPVWFLQTHWGSGPTSPLSVGSTRPAPSQARFNLEPSATIRVLEGFFLALAFSRA